MSELQCFVSTISNVSSDDDGDCDAGPLIIQQPRGWASSLRPSWLGSGLRLRVKGLSGFGGASLSRWLESRDSSPLSAAYFARCAPRSNCAECNSARNLTCETLDLGSLCRACAEGASLYCAALGSPTLCPRWDRQKVQEFTRRWEFFQREPVKTTGAVEPGPIAEVGVSDAGGMTTRTVQQSDTEVTGVPSNPARSATLPTYLSGRPPGLTLDRRAGEARMNSLATSRIGALHQSSRKTLVEQIAGAEKADHESFKKSYVATGVFGKSVLGSNLADKVSDCESERSGSQGCGGTGKQGLVQPSRQDRSRWEQGSCPLNPGHCASTPSQPIRPFGGFPGVDISGVSASRAAPPPPFSARAPPLFERVAGSLKKEVRFDPEAGANRPVSGGREWQRSEVPLDQSSRWGDAQRLDPSVLTHLIHADVHANAHTAENLGDLRGVGNEQGGRGPSHQQLGAGVSHLFPTPAATVQGGGAQASDNGDEGGRGPGRRRNPRQGGDPSDRGSGGGNDGGRGRRNANGGGGDGDGSSDGDDSPPPRRRRRRPGDPPDQLSDALGLIVDRLESLSVTGGRPPGAKQKPISIPSIPREPDGSVSALSFWEWLILISRLVADLSLDESHVLLVLITDPKVLPAQWRQVCMGSDSLAEALKRLCDKNAPRTSTYPLLVGRLTGLDPTDGTHEEVIRRAGDLLATLSLLRQLHPDRDLSREEALATLFTLGSSLELQSGMLDAVDEMTFLQGLPTSDQRRQSFVTSLANYLERQRKIRSDLLASVACGRYGGQALDPPHMTSFAQPVRAAGGGQGGGTKPGVGRGVLPRGKGGAGGGISGKSGERGQVGSVAGGKIGAASKSGTNSKSKPVCGFNCGQSHPTWECKKVLDVRLKRTPIPSTVCAKCCSVLKPGLPHQPNCHIHEFKRAADGKLCRINRLCPAHKSEGRHHLLCSSCGKDPQVVKPLPVVAAHSTSLAPAQQPLGGVGVVGREAAKIPRVLFMSEVLSLVDKGGHKLRVVVHYDTMSGATFCSGVPNEFNHGEEHLSTELFNLSTFVGEESYSLPVVILKLLGQVGSQKGPQSITSYVSDYPSIPPVDLPQSLLQLKPGNASPEDLEKCTARLMLGAEYSDYFPTQVKTPACIRREYVGMVAYKSRLSGRLLLAGQLDRGHRRPVAPF